MFFAEFHACCLSIWFVSMPVGDDVHIQLVYT